MKNRLKLSHVVAVLPLALHAPMTAQAQITETNPAPLLLGSAKAQLTPFDVLDISGDPTPFGVNLSRLVVVNTRGESVAQNANTRRRGIDTSRAGQIADDPELSARLQKFLDKPLSFLIIGEIQTEITRFYRDRARPLVAVTIPPQEISGGTLRIDVLPFRLENVRVEQNTRAPNDHFADQIRQKKDEEIDSEQLSEDLNWLNLNPFREVQLILEPGSAFGTTNVVLSVAERRRWSANVSYANSGAATTGRDRLFFSFNTDRLPVPDHQVGYQFAIDPETLASGDLLKAKTGKGYASHALSYFAPIVFENGLRSKLSLQAFHVSTSSVAGGVLQTDSTVNEVKAELAFPGMRRTGDIEIVPETFINARLNSKQEHLTFQSVPLGKTQTDTITLSTGVRASFTGTMFGHQGNASLEASLAFGNSEGTGFTYATFSGEQTLFFESGRTLSMRLSGQIGTNDVPSSNFFGLGGAGTVRGYDTNEVSSHSGIFSSVELQNKERQIGENIDVVAFQFIDFGAISSTASNNGQALLSVGAGARLDLGNGYTGEAQVAVALRSASQTHSGDTGVHVKFSKGF